MNQDLTKQLAQAQAELVASKEATARAEAKIAAVQAELAKPTEWKRWEPEHQQAFYRLTAGGSLFPDRWVGNRSDRELFDFGNCFPTREAAERHAKRLRSMVPTCPVPKKGEQVFCLTFSQVGTTIDAVRWDESEWKSSAYNMGRVFATRAAARDWASEFADAWTTLEDAS